MMPDTPYPITDDMLKIPAKPAKDEYSFEEMQDRLKKIGDVQQPQSDEISFEEMQRREMADKNVAAMDDMRRAVGSFFAPIGTAITAPARTVLGSLETAGQLGAAGWQATARADPKGAGDILGKIWERAYTGAEPTPVREALAKSGIPSKENIPTGFRDIQMRSIKTSPANVLGGVLEAGADPLNWPSGGVPAFQSVGKAFGEGERIVAAKMGKAASDAWGGSTKMAGRTLASIPADDWDYLIANRERLKKRQKPEPFETMVSETEAAINPYVEATQKAVSNAEKVASDARRQYRNYQQTLREPTQDLVEQRKLMGSVANVKRELSDLSAQADEVLAKSPATFDRQHIIELIDNVGKDLGNDIVGDQAQRAKNSLLQLKERISDPNGSPLSSSDLRSILRQVRADIDWDRAQLVGSYDDPLTIARKKFTHHVSRVLKDTVPEYKSLMDQMSPLADVLDDMSRLFGNEDRATGTLDRIRRGGAKGQISREILEKFASLTGNREIPDLLQEFEGRQKALKVMQRSSPEQGMAQLMPEVLEGERKALSGAIAAEEKSGPMTQMSVPAMYKTLSELRDNNIAAARQGTAILGETGINPIERGRDYGVLKRLNRDRAQGSRLTKGGSAIGGALGTGIGGMVGGASGAVAGGAMGTALGTTAGLVGDRYAGNIAKGMIDVGTSIRQNARSLSQNILVRLPVKFAKVLTSVGEKYGFGVANLYHHTMYNNDPEYRAAVDAILRSE